MQADIFDPKLKSYDNIPDLDNKIKELQDMIRENFETDPTSGAKKDYDLVMSNDAAIISYLETNNWSVEQAYKMVKRIGKYRLINYPDEIKVTQMPREFLQLHMLNPKMRDRFGRPVLWTRFTFPPKEILDVYKTFHVWAYNELMISSVGNSVKPCLIFDATLFKADFSVAKPISELLNNITPPWAYPVLIYGLSPIYRWAFKLFRYLFPKSIRDSFTLIDDDFLHDLLGGEDKLPKYMGGQEVPCSDEKLDLCPTLKEYTQSNGISYEPIQKWLDNFVNELE